jgi:hypothetical protein
VAAAPKTSGSTALISASVKLSEMRDISPVIVGAAVGEAVGAAVGAADGAAVGAAVGATVGACTPIATKTPAANRVSQHATISSPGVKNRRKYSTSVSAVPGATTLPLASCVSKI